MSRSDVLVDADWVQAHAGDEGVVLVEVDEDTTAYDKGHIKGALKIDWENDLQDRVKRDFVDRAGFEALLSARGGGHIPGAKNVPWSKAAAEDGTFKPDEALGILCADEAGLARENVGPSAYRQHCERSVRMSDTLGAVPETGRAYRS